MLASCYFFKLLRILRIKNEIIFFKPPPTSSSFKWCHISFPISLLSRSCTWLIGIVIYNRISLVDFYSFSVSFKGIFYPSCEVKLLSARNHYSKTWIRGIFLGIASRYYDLPTEYHHVFSLVISSQSENHSRKRSSKAAVHPCTKWTWI